MLWGEYSRFVHECMDLLYDCMVFADMCMHDVCIVRLYVVVHVIYRPMRIYVWMY